MHNEGSFVEIHIGTATPFQHEPILLPADVQIITLDKRDHHETVSAISTAQASGGRGRESENVSFPVPPLRSLALPIVTGPPPPVDRHTVVHAASRTAFPRTPSRALIRALLAYPCNS